MLTCNLRRHHNQGSTWVQLGKESFSSTDPKKSLPQPSSKQRSPWCRASKQAEGVLHLLLFSSLEMQMTIQAGRQVSLFRAIWDAICFICLSCRTQSDMWLVALHSLQKLPHHCKLISRRAEHTKTKQLLSRNAASGEVTLPTSLLPPSYPFVKLKFKSQQAPLLMRSCTKEQGTHATKLAAPTPPTCVPSVHLFTPISKTSN